MTDNEPARLLATTSSAAHAETRATGSRSLPRARSRTVQAGEVPRCIAANERSLASGWQGQGMPHLYGDRAKCATFGSSTAPLKAAEEDDRPEQRVVGQGVRIGSREPQEHAHHLGDRSRAAPREQWFARPFR